MLKSGDYKMHDIFEYLSSVIDHRQEHKVKHLMKDIIAIVLFAKLANANKWDEIHYFAVVKESFLRKYLELTNGIPSYDTIRRVMAMVSPEFLGKLQVQWNEMLSSNQGTETQEDSVLRRQNPKGQQAWHSRSKPYC